MVEEINYGIPSGIRCSDCLWGCIAGDDRKTFCEVFKVRKDAFIYRECLKFVMK